MSQSEENKAINIIVYDVCNLDSTISAALLQENKDWVSISCDSPEFPYNTDFTYHWIGTTPSDTQRQKLFSAKNVAYSISPVSDKFFDGGFSLANIPVDDDAFKPHKALLQVIDNVLGDYNSKNPGVIWNVAEKIEKFMVCDKRMELNCIATLWVNYEAALAVLTLSTTDDYVMIDYVTESVETMFLEFLKTVKRRLSRAWCICPVQIGKQFFDIPVLNLETDISPWAMKIAAITHDRVMIFHTYGHQMYASVFTRCEDYHNFKHSAQSALEQVNVSFWY